VDLDRPSPPVGFARRAKDTLLYRWVSPAYDWLEERYEGDGARRGLTAVLVVLFLAGIGYAEAVRQGLIGPDGPTSHFVAVEIVFTGLLAVEVVGLVMGIVGSVANAMGKQIEILSLILLRDAFKQFSHFGEPIEWASVEPYILQILADVTGGLVLFVIIGVYYRIQKHQPITRDPASRRSFIAVKKLVALAMIAVFVGVGIHDLWRNLSGQATYPFFQTFYTVLIFADVLVVLVSLRYTSTYAVVFRNSGFTLITVLIRLTLTAPRYYDVALGVGAALIALGLAWAYYVFSPPLMEPAPGEPAEMPP
jgi:hypothetical protein